MTLLSHSSHGCAQGWGTIHTSPCCQPPVRLRNVRPQLRGTWGSCPWPCQTRDSQQLLRQLRELQGGWQEQQDVPARECGTDPLICKLLHPKVSARRISSHSVPGTCWSYTCVALCHCMPRELGYDWRHTQESIRGVTAIVWGYRGKHRLQGGARSFMTHTATDGTRDCAPITTRCEPSFGKMV